MCISCNKTGYYLDNDPTSEYQNGLIVKYCGCELGEFRKNTKEIFDNMLKRIECLEKELQYHKQDNAHKFIFQ